MTAGEADILLLGATGQVGRRLLPVLAKRGRVSAPNRAALDLTDLAAVRETIASLRPALIVNSAALSMVDRAEAEPELAFALNEHLPRLLAEESARTGALLVHFSTDYVFGGQSTVPYRETDPTAPVNIYGKSKLAGDIAIEDSGAAHLILRTSWVYGPQGNNFVSHALQRLRENREIVAVTDQRSRPTWSRRLAESVGAILDVLRTGDRWLTSSPLIGVYHLAGGGDASRYEFATALAAELRTAGATVRSDIRGVSSDQFAAPARRPAYSVLDTTKVANAFDVSLPDWRLDLPAIVRAGEAW